MDSADLTLSEVEAKIWVGLGRGVADRRHGFHHPVVSTIDSDGLPTGRVMILRAADRERLGLRFHTDVRSHKWTSLHANAAVSVCLYDETARTQLRISGSAVLHSNDETALMAWNKSQRMSRVVYGISPGPGTPISEAGDFMLTEDQDIVAQGYSNFGLIEVSIHAIEWVYLQQSKNRRARFDYIRNQSNWLVP